jgi:hypothetical protein
MEDVLKKYQDARSALSEYFDAEIWHNLIILDEQEWTDYGGQYDSVGWEKIEDNDWTDFNYGFEIYGTSRWLSKDGKYTLFVGDDAYGFFNELLWWAKDAERGDGFMIHKIADDEIVISAIKTDGVNFTEENHMHVNYTDETSLALFIQRVRTVFKHMGDD